MSLELPEDRCFVIAEAGTCHADLEERARFRRAMKYVLAAKRVGADAVKFQIFAENVKSDMFCWIEGDERRARRWMMSVLGVAGWYQIKEYTEACGMVFLASVFQESTVKLLSELGVVATKVASRAAKNFPYEKAPGPFLISLGMGYPSWLAQNPGKAYALECEANYPSTRIWAGKTTGFSDHSGTPWRAIDAISRGCRLLEVHFYIDPLDAGPDLPASLNLDQLKLVCEARDAFAEIRNSQ